MLYQTFQIHAIFGMHTDNFFYIWYGQATHNKNVDITGKFSVTHWKCHGDSILCHDPGVAKPQKACILTLLTEDRTAWSGKMADWETEEDWRGKGTIKIAPWGFTGRRRGWVWPCKPRRRTPRSGSPQPHLRTPGTQTWARWRVHCPCYGPTSWSYSSFRPSLVSFYLHRWRHRTAACCHPRVLLTTPADWARTATSLTATWCPLVKWPCDYCWGSVGQAGCLDYSWTAARTSGTG